MGDRIDGAAAAKKLLEEDERLRKKIFAHAYSLTHNLNDAKELSQDAMAKVIDPEASPWDRDRQPSLLLHVGSLMNGAAANKRRGEGRHPTASYSEDDDPRPDPAPLAIESLVNAEDRARLERWMNKLRVALAGDDVALGKIDLLYQGIEDGDEQAARLHCEVREIYRANERIAYHVDRIKKAEHRRAPLPDERRGPNFRPEDGP